MFLFLIHQSEKHKELKLNRWAYSWDEGSAMKPNLLYERGETHSLSVSACTWMFSAQGHTYSNNRVVVHSQTDLSAIKTAFQCHQNYCKITVWNVF